MAQPKSVAGIILLFIIIVGDILTGAVSSHVAPSVHPRFTVQFSVSLDPSKYSLDSENTLVNGLTSTTVRQGQFPSSVNLFVYYVWCDTTVSGGNIILQQTGGAGWTYTFACGTGQSSSGNPGTGNVLFTQSLGANNNYDIVFQNTNTLADTMQGGFVVSTTNTNTQNALPGLAGSAFQTVFKIPTGKTLYVWLETGLGAGCAAGVLVCYIGINPLVSGGNCRLDLSGGSFATSGDAEASTAVCTITGNSSFAWESVMFNGDTAPHPITGLFLVSIY